MLNALIAHRLNSLRMRMKQWQLDYYYIPSTDAHQNEYVPSPYQRREWISGFSGSAGDALVGQNVAYLWTDPRYHLQAEQELDLQYYQLMKWGQLDVPSIEVWLQSQGHALRVGVDPRVISLDKERRISHHLKAVEGLLLPIDTNLIDAISDGETGVIQANTMHPVRFIRTETSVAQKLEHIRDQLALHHAHAFVTNVLDEIAWMFNIRGQDILYNPLVISYAIITKKQAIWYVDEKKVDNLMRKILAEVHVTIASYEAIAADLQGLDESVWLDPKTASVWMASKVSQGSSRLLEYASPISLPKAVKDQQEQMGAYEAHIFDAVAMIQFLYWLERHWRDGITEAAAAEQLARFRQAHAWCMGLSFETISAFGAHSAMIHYTAGSASRTIIDDSSLYLVDSGGQYCGRQESRDYCGTTDITRTIHLGVPTALEKKHYTWVLKGHLALGHAVFPKGVCGENLDVLARQYLWQAGLDYGHGTGHGVGSYLCVHEGPHSISPRSTQVPLEPGMIVSNEPGLYLPGHYGIRIENLCMVTLRGEPVEAGKRQYYRFKDLTLVPYARALIDVFELTQQEKVWIDSYHKHIFNTLSARLGEAEQAWLVHATAPLSNG